MANEIIKDDVKEEDFTKKKRVGLAALIIVVCVLLVIGTILGVLFSFLFGKKGKGKWGGPWEDGSMPVSVKSQTGKIETLNDYVITNGEISALSSVNVLPDMAGRLVSVRVNLGDKVSRGQLIAYVDPSTPGSQYANSPVYAPITGTVTQTPVAAGTKVNQSSVITVIGDTSTLQISANISERYVAALAPGLKAEVKLEAYGDEIFTATVAHVSPVLDSVSRTKQIILLFDQKDERINAGMFARIKLYTYDYSGAITVPVDAIVEKNNVENVWVIDEEKELVTLRPVTTGHSVDNMIQLLTGVEEGEKIVIEGMRNLSEGARIIDVAKSRQE